MTRLEREETPAVEHRAVWPKFAIGFALLAAIATFSFRYWNHSPGSGELAAVAPPRSERIAIALPEITPEQVQALTLKLDQPLEKELKNVISDTRQAIQFVASSFLPEK